MRTKHVKQMLQTSTIHPLIAMMLNQSDWHWWLVNRVSGQLPRKRHTVLSKSNLLTFFLSRFIAPILGGWLARKVNNQLDLCKSLNSSNGWNEYITIQNFWMILKNNLTVWTVFIRQKIGAGDFYFELNKIEKEWGCFWIKQNNVFKEYQSI